MPLLREDPDFGAAIANAARDLGDLDPSFVEKDYWVTQVLRVLHTSFANGFTFKGGTSLSKGYRIIERFSEDVDILVVPLAGASNQDADDHLLAITGAVSTALQLEWEEARAPGRGKDGSRGDLLRYEPRVDAGVRIGIGPGAVLLETGYGGGDEPAEMVTITPLICEGVGLDPEEHDDTRAFRVRALQPRRTLIEKLFAVHHFATQFEEGNVPEARLGRHFYDIHKLLEHRPTLDQLGKERHDFERIVGEVERLSRIQFGGTTPRPDGGFADSPAFAPARETDLRRWLEQKYEEALQLLPRAARPPSFGDIMKRVHELREIL
jgi:hypothetical protein